MKSENDIPHASESAHVVCPAGRIPDHMGEMSGAVLLLFDEPCLGRNGKKADRAKVPLF